MWSKDLKCGSADRFRPVILCVFPAFFFRYWVLDFLLLFVLCQSEPVVNICFMRILYIGY